MLVVMMLGVHDEKIVQQLGSWKFDQDYVKEGVSIMIIADEEPFKIVENPGFRTLMSRSCPMFKIPSRKTAAKGVFTLYLEEKTKLKSFLRESSQRVSLTTDTWTSIQRMNYMCLTVHFIDDSWKLHKYILNFCPISGHKGDEIAKDVEKCLREWGIDEKVFTVTADNASANDVAISHLVKRLNSWGNSILNGKYMHMRCMAHILNLVVQEGMKEHDEHIAINRIRAAVRFIRGSAARYQRFSDCVEQEKLQSKKLLCLDVPTRWNSTYLMLEAAVALRKAFVAYEDVDRDFASDLMYFDDSGNLINKGIPTSYDWKKASVLLKFLGHFYDLTLKVSSSMHVDGCRIRSKINSILKPTKLIARVSKVRIHRDWVYLFLSKQEK